MCTYIMVMKFYAYTMLETIQFYHMGSKLNAIKWITVKRKYF